VHMLQNLTEPTARPSQLVDLGITRRNLRVAAILAANTSARDEHSADDDEQKRNSETDGNNEDYQQRESVRDWCTETNGKRPGQNQTDNS